MNDTIRIERPHALGLAKARELAAKWAEDAEEQYGMACRIDEGEHGDVLHFSRAGMRGTLAVEAGRLALEARLGILLAGLRSRIQSEAEKQLDKLLRLESRAASERKAGGGG
ncbi:polyhydroxyalkanoic acid system family protein [Aquabacterium sp. A7-Y]|uniref:polyhydroxyalkanoic acid system family protein n=1 Tax=Aquabacterium sp. A7-Y TaxID=1349605 RepID=UPI00223CE623|nr:polyhydroxyalkanoic acid system family protein [Aquabacterium sp. A7-Y]MCW7539034.1 polyhydroxyalkanoic acid system family protein [Aquabacterium sp. A7-Y]